MFGTGRAKLFRVASTPLVERHQWSCL